jgi:hypothetical protein
MTDDKRPSRRHSAFFDLEQDPERDAVTRPASVLRSTEWGGLTLLSLLAGLAFPPYFLSVMALACLNAGGMLWVSHLNEAGRKRLKEFEAEFAQGHALEERGDFRGAVALYSGLAPRYADQAQIAQIAVHRVAHLKQTHPEAFGRAVKAKAAPPASRAQRGLGPAAERALETKPAAKSKLVKNIASLRIPKGSLQRKPA